MTHQPISDFFPDAQARFAAFWEPIASDANIVVFCHFDADGLAAGALFGRLLAAMGYSNVHVEPSGKGENAFTDSARERIGALTPDALVVTDLGVSALGVLPDVPTLYVDHHLPTGEPNGATVITGYGVDPIPNSAWLAHELFRPLVDEEVHAQTDWIAAVGTLSDLGDKAPWPPLAQRQEAVYGEVAQRSRSPVQRRPPRSSVRRGDAAAHPDDGRSPTRVRRRQRRGDR